MHAWKCACTLVAIVSVGMTLSGCDIECAVQVSEANHAMVSGFPTFGALPISVAKDLITKQLATLSKSACAGGNDLPPAPACWGLSEGMSILLEVTSFANGAGTLDYSGSIPFVLESSCTGASFTLEADGTMTLVKEGVQCDDKLDHVDLVSAKFCGGATGALSSTINLGSVMGETQVDFPSMPCPTTTTTTTTLMYKCTFPASQECCEAINVNAPYNSTIDATGVSECSDWEINYAAHGALCVERTNTCKDEADESRWAESCREDLDWVKPGNCVSAMGSPDVGCLRQHFAEQYTEKCSETLADFMACSVLAGRDACFSICAANKDGDPCRKCGEQAAIDMCQSAFGRESSLEHCPYVYHPEEKFDMSMSNLRLRVTSWIAPAAASGAFAAMVLFVAIRRHTQRSVTSEDELLVVGCEDAVLAE